MGGVGTGSMRLIVAGLAMLGLVQAASAADYGPPVLRGSAWDSNVPVYGDVSGFYIGATAGVSLANADFGDSARTVLGDLLRFSILDSEFNVPDWLAPPSATGSGSSVGAFVGYNWQSEDTVFGFEATYNRTSASASSSETIARIIDSQDNYQYNITASANLAAELTDILTLRGRGGVAIGSFVPYATLGVAVGRVNIRKTVSVSYPQPLDLLGGQPVLPAFAASASENKRAFAFGLAAGLGFDWELVQGLFLRAEYEYAAFAPVEDVKLTAHSARAGVGVRF